MTPTGLIKQIDTKLHTLPPAKLVVVLDFVNYLAERDPTQAWFWTTEWQASERETEAELECGDYEDFDTMDDFITSLKAEAVAS